MIRDYPFNLAPGAEVRPPIVGDYVALKSSSKDLALVQIQAEGENGQVVANIEVLQGQGIPIPRGYGRLVIRNLDPVDTIDIVIVAGVGAFESFRLSGSVSFAGNLPGIDTPVNISELAGSTLQKVNAVGLVEPVKLDGSHWEHQGLSTTLQTIFTPASNVSGINIKRAQSCLGTARLMCKQSAPLSWNDDSANTLTVSQYTGYGHSGVSSIENFQIPAGYGLYFWGTDAMPQQCYVDYEVL